MTPLAYPVAVISDDYWTRQLRRSPDVLGQTIVINGTPFVVVGVVPRGFTGEWVGRAVDIWVTTMMQGRVMIEALDSLTRRNNYWLRMVGRLRPGVRLPQADAALQPVYQQTMRDEAARTPGGPGPEGLAAATARADSGIARLFTRTRCARGIDPDADARRRPDPADCVRQPGGAIGVALGGPAAGIRAPTGDWRRRRSTGPAAPDRNATVQETAARRMSGRDGR